MNIANFATVKLADVKLITPTTAADHGRNNNRNLSHTVLCYCAVRPKTGKYFGLLRSPKLFPGTAAFNSELRCSTLQSIIELS